MNNLPILSFHQTLQITKGNSLVYVFPYPVPFSHAYSPVKHVTDLHMHTYEGLLYGLIVMFALWCTANCFSHLKTYNEYSSRAKDVPLTLSS